MAKIIVPVIQDLEGRLLIGLGSPDRGGSFAKKWHLAGDKLKDREAEQDAAKRIAKDNYGIKVEVNAFLGEGTALGKKSISKYYLCEVMAQNKIFIGKRLKEAIYVPANELQNYIGSDLIEMIGPAVYAHLELHMTK